MIGMFKLNIALNGLNHLIKHSNDHFNMAMSRGAIQFLTWCNTGSMGSPKKPPIKWGVLRGSSSAFVGTKLVSVYPQDIDSEAEEKPSPARSVSGLSAKPNDITATFVWNTEYATAMHEWDVPPHHWGLATLRDYDAGSKWLEEHLKADKDALMKMVAIEFRMELGS